MSQLTRHKLILHLLWRVQQHFQREISHLNECQPPPSIETHRKPHRHQHEPHPALALQHSEEPEMPVRELTLLFTPPDSKRTRILTTPDRKELKKS